MGFVTNNNDKSMVLEVEKRAEIERKDKKILFMFQTGMASMHGILFDGLKDEELLSMFFEKKKKR